MFAFQTPISSKIFGDENGQRQRGMNFPAYPEFVVQRSEEKYNLDQMDIREKLLGSSGQQARFYEMKQMGKQILIVFVFLLASTPTWAKMHKCIGKSGTIIYSNTPCPPGSEAEEMKGYEKGEASPVVETGSSNRPAPHDGKKNVEAEGERSSNRSYEKVKQISSGENVNLRRFIEPGVLTVFMFHADWCLPCNKIKPEIEERAMNSKSFALRQIDLTNPEAPVAEQYRVKSVPYFMVYRSDGTLMYAGSEISGRFTNLE